MKEKVAKPTAGAGLFKKIMFIQTAGAKVYKDTTAKLSGSNRKVASIDSVLETYLPLCKEYGLAIIPVRHVMNRLEIAGNKIDMVIEAFFKVVDTDSGEFHEFSLFTHGQDYGGDKATGKACTYAMKYAFRTLFCNQSTEDDPDVIGDPPKGNTQQRQQRQPESESDNDADDSKRQDDDDKTIKAKEAFAKAQADLKKVYPSDKAVADGAPKWEGMQSAAKGIALTHKLTGEALTHFKDYVFFWWHCLNVIGEPDVAKALKIFESAEKKKKFTKKNADFLRSKLKERQAVSTKTDREPGDDAPDAD